MRELQQLNEEVFRAKLQMKKFFPCPGGQCLLWLILATQSLAPLYAQSPADASFLASADSLCTASFEGKGQAAEQMVQSGHPSARPTLTALLEDRLYCRNQDQKVFLVRADAQDSPTIRLIDPLTMKAAVSAASDDVTRVVTNNHLRRVLQTMLARFGLSSSDTRVRLDAVKDIEQRSE